MGRGYGTHRRLRRRALRAAHGSAIGSQVPTNDFREMHLFASKTSRAYRFGALIPYGAQE